MNGRINVSRHFANFFLICKLADYARLNLWRCCDFEDAGTALPSFANPTLISLPLLKISHRSLLNVNDDTSHVLDIILCFVQIAFTFFKRFIRSVSDDTITAIMAMRIMINNNKDDDKNNETTKERQ